MRSQSLPRSIPGHRLTRPVADRPRSCDTGTGRSASTRAGDTTGTRPSGGPRPRPSCRDPRRSRCPQRCHGLACRVDATEPVGGIQDGFPAPRDLRVERPIGPQVDHVRAEPEGRVVKLPASLARHPGWRDHPARFGEPRHVTPLWQPGPAGRPPRWCPPTRRTSPCRRRSPRSCGPRGGAGRGHRCSRP